MDLQNIDYKIKKYRYKLENTNMYDNKILYQKKLTYYTISKQKGGAPPTQIEITEISRDMYKRELREYAGESITKEELIKEEEIIKALIELDNQWDALPILMRKRPHDSFAEQESRLKGDGNQILRMQKDLKNTITERILENKVKECEDALDLSQQAQAERRQEKISGSRRWVSPHEKKIMTERRELELLSLESELDDACTPEVLEELDRRRKIGRRAASRFAALHMRSDVELEREAVEERERYDVVTQRIRAKRAAEVRAGKPHAYETEREETRAELERARRLAMDEASAAASATDTPTYRYPPGIRERIIAFMIGKDPAEVPGSLEQREREEARALAATPVVEDLGSYIDVGEEHKMLPPRGD